MKRMTMCLLCVVIVLSQTTVSPLTVWAEGGILSCVMNSENFYDTALATDGDIVTLSGQTGEGVMVVAVTLGGLSVPCTQIGVDWSASVAVDERIAEGPMGFEVSYSQESQSLTSSVLTEGAPVTVDRTPPEGLSVLLKQGFSTFYDSGTWTKTPVTAYFKEAVDAGGSVTYLYDAGAGWIEKSFIEISANGTTILRAKVRDEAGNESPEEIRNICIDRTPPSDNAPFGEALSSTSIEITANITGFEGDVAPPDPLIGYKYKISEIAAGAVPLESFWVPDGKYTFEGLRPNTCYSLLAKARDAAGNIDEYTRAAMLYTRAADPEAVGVTSRTNSSLSYAVENAGQEIVPENKLILKNAAGEIIDQGEFSRATEGAFEGLKAGTYYEIWNVARNEENLENEEKLYWSGTTRHVPEGDIRLPSEDIILKDGQVFSLEGTFMDIDGDEVLIAGAMGEAPGTVTIGDTTWSALWNTTDLIEGRQAAPWIELSDDGGTAVNIIVWPHELIVDKTPPLVHSILLETDNASPLLAKPGDVLTLVFRTDESIADPLIQLDGVLQEAESNGSQWQAQWIMESGMFPEGPLDYSIEATDLAGNKTVSSGESAIIYDETPPLVHSLLLETDNASPLLAKPGDVLTLVFRTDESIADPLIQLDGVLQEAESNGSQWQAQWIMESGMFPEGPLDYSIEATDLAGNKTVSSGESAITYDETPPPSPSMAFNPESGTSTRRVAISFLAGESSERQFLEYRLVGPSDTGWMAYNMPFEVTDKGAWSLLGRSSDEAGNRSAVVEKNLLLKESREREPEPQKPEASYWELNLSYIVPSGEILEMDRIFEAFDKEGNLIENAGLLVESSDETRMKVLGDGSLMAGGSGQVLLWIIDPASGKCFELPLLIEGLETGKTPLLEDIEGHWAEDKIRNFCSRGLLTGYEDGTFRPERLVSAEECFAMMERVRLAEEKSLYEKRVFEPAAFKAGDWSRFYDLSVFGRMGQESVTAAFGENPVLDRFLKRGEIAFILAESGGWGDEYSGEGSSFSDVASHNFEAAIACAQSHGVMTGYPDGTFRPDHFVTRAEMAAILSRDR